MKKFNFPLEKILQFKNQTLDSLKFDLANLQLQLTNKMSEIEALKNKYRETDNVYINKTKSSILPFEIVYYKNYLDKLVNDIKKLLDEKQIITKKIEKKKSDIINMNKEISTLDKLKEKKIEEYNKYVLKTEEVFIDEFVSNSNMVTIHH